MLFIARMLPGFILSRSYKNFLRFEELLNHFIYHLILKHQHVNGYVTRTVSYPANKLYNKSSCRYLDGFLKLFYFYYCPTAVGYFVHYECSAVAQFS